MAQDKSASEKGFQMARRKNREREKSIPAEQNVIQEKNDPNHKIIGQLMGTLEEALDENIEEIDAAEFTEPEAPAKEKRHRAKQRLFFSLGVFVIVMAIIGCISTVSFVANLAHSIADNSSLKNEFAAFLYPVVASDAPTFDSVENIPNKTKINCAIWNIILNGENSTYEKQNGYMTVPEIDVEQNVKFLFGTSITVEHQTVGDIELLFEYDSERKSYTVPESPRYIAYSPYITEISNVGESYTLTVGYLPPMVASVAGVENIEVNPEKYMQYKVTRVGNKCTLTSIMYTDGTDPAHPIS